MGNENPHPRQPAWPYWLGASAIAIACAGLAYRLAKGPEPYSQFTVGSITWRAASKGADYVMLLALVAGFAAAWLAMLLVERRIEQRLGSAAVSSARALIAYASLPLVLLASTLVLGTASLKTPVALAAAGVTLALALLALATSGRGTDTGAGAGASRAGDAAPAQEPGSVAPVDAAGIVFLTATLGALSALVGAFAINRVGLLARSTFIWNGVPSPLAIASAGALAGLAAGVWVWRRRHASARGLAGVLVLAQMILPAGFLAVVPTPWALGSVITSGVPRTRVLCVGAALIAVALVDLLRRYRRLGRGDATTVRPLDVLSPLALAGAVFFLKQGSIHTGYLNPDDYHFGESLLPWWSLTTHGALPFWDFVPARGLMNYVNGALAAVLFDSTASGIVATGPVLTALIVAIAIVPVASLIGALPAALAFLLLPISHYLSQIDALNTAALATLCAAYPRWRASTWLTLWLGLGTAAFLAAPAQGAVLVLATLPLGVWQLARAWRHERPLLWRVTAGTAVVALLLLAATPLARMVFGAIRYAREHSAVGGPAHAIEWANSTVTFKGLNQWLFDAIRASWIGVGLAGIALLLSAWVRRERVQRDALLLIGVPIVLMAVLFIYRAGGRVDPGTVSRPGSASIWMLSLLVPLLLHAAWGARRWPTIATIMVAGAGLILSQEGPLDLAAAAARGFETVNAPADFGKARRLGFTAIGDAQVEEAQLGRLTTIQRVLAVLLDSQETYLDLTNRNAQYYYLNRRVPIESGAPYNLPNDRQQLRAIAALEARPVPVVLAWADTQDLDGGPQSYRAHAIYRYVVWRYVPVRIAGLVFLVRPDRLARLTARGDLPVDATITAPELFDVAFRWKELQGLPASWGASWDTLDAAVTQVRALGDGARAADMPSVTWDFSATPIAGKDAGILTFDFECLGGVGGTPLEMTWAAPGAEPDPAALVGFDSAPRITVPLDAAPRWLMAPAIGQLQIRVRRPDLCPDFSIRHATLWQRRVAAATDRH